MNLSKFLGMVQQAKPWRVTFFDQANSVEYFWTYWGAERYVKKHPFPNYQIWRKGEVGMWN